MDNLKIKNQIIVTENLVARACAQGAVYYNQDKFKMGLYKYRLAAILAEKLKELRKSS